MVSGRIWLSLRLVSETCAIDETQAQFEVFGASCEIVRRIGIRFHVLRPSEVPALMADSPQSGSQGANFCRYCLQCGAGMVKLRMLYVDQAAVMYAIS